MSERSQRWSVRLLLAAFAAAGLCWLASLDYGKKISTNVLDLVPSDERSPELALARDMAGDRQARVALFALDLPAGSQRRAEVEQAFAASLRASPLFAEAVALQDTTARNNLGRALFEQRFDLLLPGWLDARWREYKASASDRPWSEWLAEHVAARLENFLGRPEALAFQELLPADPLLLMPELVEKVQGLQSPAMAGAGTAALVWARTSVSPWTEEGQKPVFEVVEKAKAAALAVEPGAGMRWMSFARFAGESRARIERELSTLNILSLAAVLGIAFLCLRGVLRSLHLAPVLLGALLGAWVATTLAFDRVHVLVFVVGSLLGGVAIDYGFYLYLQPPLYPGEQYHSKVGRLIRPLLASALTTVTGFSLLLFSELPMIRQLGVFVSAGLLSALVTALLWFAQVGTPFMATRDFARARYHGDRAWVRRGVLALLVAGAVVGLCGPWFLQWRDDIRELEIPAPALAAEAGAVRALFGDIEDRSAYITRGRSVAEARERLAAFEAWHAARHPAQPLVSVGAALPVQEAWNAQPERLAGLEDFVPALMAALERHGFEAAPFQRFAEGWQAWRAAPRPTYEAAMGRFLALLNGPLGMMVSVGGDHAWFISVAGHPGGEQPPPELATVTVSGLQDMNRLFSRYRVSALHLSMAGLGLVGVSMFFFYGVWRGLKIFALPVGSCFFAFGVLGLTGQTVGLFHLIGAFLGVCLSHNYAIFTAENAARGEEQPPSIRLSALTTAASFGVLALSRIPVVKALGLTVALIVMTALVVVEALPLARRAAPRR